MFEASVYKKRRERLKKHIHGGIILLQGNNDVPMNYPGNPYSFRQDSSFLYYTGVNTPGFAIIMDLDTGEDTLYGYDLSVDDIIWMGELPGLRDWASQGSIENTKTYHLLAEDTAEAKRKGRKIHYINPYRYDLKIELSKMLNTSFEALVEGASEDLIKGIVAMRSIKEAREIAEMESALHTTKRIYLQVIRNALPGVREQILAGMAEGIAIENGGRLAYPAILSRDGEILHNHHHHHILKDGDLVLADIGAEAASGYASDITRTFPAGRTFTNAQRAIYQIVLDAEVSCIEMLKPGIPYREVHLHAARIITEGLKTLGLMKGDTEEAVQAGAHALFFPHGLGHMIGLDVHDMENLGEDHVGYSDTVKRSNQFGTAYLRLGRELKPGFVLTVEPGIYFIPALIDLWEKENKHTGFIRYEMVSRWRTFGGIRIEDNVLITKEGHRVLGPPIPKTIEEIENLKIPLGTVLK